MYSPTSTNLDDMPFMQNKRSLQSTVRKSADPRC